MAKKAYPCIGGPLDGQHATTDDFRKEWIDIARPEHSRPSGMYVHLKDDYCAFNNASRAITSMIFVHRSLLKPPIDPRRR